MGRTNWIFLIRHSTRPFYAYENLLTRYWWVNRTRPTVTRWDSGAGLELLTFPLSAAGASERRKPAESERGIQKGRRRNGATRLRVLSTVTSATATLGIQSSHAADVEWIYPYVWNQPIEYILAGLLVLVVMGWPFVRRLILKWRNRRTRRAFEERQRRLWSGHKRK